MSDLSNQHAEKKGLFLLGQRFSRLSSEIKGSTRRYFVCGHGAKKEGPGSNEKERQIEAWTAIHRNEVGMLATTSPRALRVAIACDAGLGKSTNMAWLESIVARAADCGQVPLLLRLDEANHPEGLHRPTPAMNLLSQESMNPGSLLNWWAGRLAHESGCDQTAMKDHLIELQKHGQITLIIDGLDHALAHDDFFTTLKELLTKSALWKHCPIWLAGRPYAFNLCWELLGLGKGWTFLKVNALEHPEIRLYLERVAGLDVYDQFAHSHDLLAVPRFLALVCAIVRGEILKMEDDSEKRAAIARCQLNCAADIYHRAYFEVDPPEEEAAESTTITRPYGFFRQALVGDAEIFGLDEGQKPSHRNVAKRIEAIGNLLGAIAFAMMDGARADGGPMPILDGMTDRELQNILGTNLKDLGLRSEGQLEERLSLLEKMNIHTLDFLLFADGGKERWIFRDATVQAFFAAYWLVRKGTPDDLQKVLEWRVDSQDRLLSAYDDFWQFAAQMPEPLVDHQKWVDIFKPSYTHPHQLKASENLTQWHRRAIYWSHSRMEALDPQEKSPGNGIFTAWRKGSRALTDQLNKGWHRCPKDEGRTGPQRFLMGSPKSEKGRFDDEIQRWVSIEPFRLQEFVVTMAQYERFDPTHKTRYSGTDHGDWPQTGVSFWDAECFAIWVGHRLPTEPEWEYACRAGTATAYSFGEEADSNRMNFVNSVYSDGSPSIKGKYPANPWGIFDMHGNVWEWCDLVYTQGGSGRVLRGGSWDDGGGDCRSAFRFRDRPEFRDINYGFRLAAVPVVGAGSGRVQ